MGENHLPTNVIANGTLSCGNFETQGRICVPRRADEGQDLSLAVTFYPTGGDPATKVFEILKMGPTSVFLSESSGQDYYLDLDPTKSSLADDGAISMKIHSKSNVTHENAKWPGL